VKEAQGGGVGLIVYNRKEGRALGEVTKFLVYNARKRQEGGDSAATYFERTECVAGVQDARFQQLMPDVLHWLGITRIDRLMSMSNMKYDAMVESGIEIGERVADPPDELVPPDASVEMEAKKAAGYFTPDGRLDARRSVAGRCGRPDPAVRRRPGAGLPGLGQEPAGRVGGARRPAAPPRPPVPGPAGPVRDGRHAPAGRSG
jgi:hypothetical protein